MRLGYARVSTDDQTLSVQTEQLKAAGCPLIFAEKQSGKTAGRPRLQHLLDVIETPCPECDRLHRAGAGLVSLGEPWADTTSYAGRMVMTVLAGVAEFERARILERTSEGRKLAKRNGVRFGRPCSLSQEQQREAVRMLKDRSVGAVARVFRVSPKTIRRLTVTQLFGNKLPV